MKIEATTPWGLYLHYLCVLTMESPVFPKSFRCYKPCAHKVYGSICITPYNSILLVLGKRSGKWSFPKGHKNRSETYLNCVVRETLEETGINLSGRIPVAHHKLSVGEYFFYEIEEELVTHILDTSEVSEARWICLDNISEMECNVDVNKFLNKLTLTYSQENHPVNVL